MAFKLGFYTTASPFYGSRIAFWRHHDAVFKKLCKEHDLEIHVILPVQGGQQFVDKLYSGNKTVLYPTLREMNITFHSDPVDIPELDALYLDDIHTLQPVTVRGIEFSVQDQRDILNSIMSDMIVDDKPILMSDTDGFTTEILEGTKAEMMTMFEGLLTLNYSKLHVTSPFENVTLRMHLGNRFHVIPFEVDPDDFRPIKPKSERTQLLRYVGNEYYRQHFIPVFDKLSKVGAVKVNGAGWNPYRHLAPNVSWGPKISMTPDNVCNVYGDSVIGLTGRSSFNAEKNQVIYLYRWKEYLTAGTLIVPENLPEYTSILPEGNLTAEGILESEASLLRLFFAMSDETYRQRVQAQRDMAVEFFGVDRWLPVFKYIFEMQD